MRCARSTRRTPRTHRLSCTGLVLCVLGVLCGGRAAGAQEPSAPQAVSPAQLKAAIDKLGDLDYATRTNASRTVRRTATPQAVPALLQAVAGHTDPQVRDPAPALPNGFHHPPPEDAIRGAVADPT